MTFKGLNGRRQRLEEEAGGGRGGTPRFDLDPSLGGLPLFSPASRVKEEVRESRSCPDWPRRKKGPEDSAVGGVGAYLDRSLGLSVRLEVEGRVRLQVGAEDAEVMVGRSWTCLGLAARDWRDSPDSPPTESSPGTWPFLYPDPPALGWLFLPPRHKEHTIFESRKTNTSSLSLMVGDTSIRYWASWGGRCVLSPKPGRMLFWLCPEFASDLG